MQSIGMVGIDTIGIHQRVEEQKFRAVRTITNILPSKTS